MKHPRSGDMPGMARLGVIGSWGQSYTLSRAHVSIRHQAARPPAGVSDQVSYLSILTTLHANCMQLYGGLSSSREAPKLHFPTFATPPSENLDFHQKSYFYLHRSQSSDPLDPYFLGGAKIMKIRGNLLWGHFRGSKSIRGSSRGRPKHS